MKRVPPKQLVELLLKVLSRNVDKTDPEFKEMVNSIVDYVNEDEGVRASIEKEKMSNAWKIVKINDVLEQEYSKKLDFSYTSGNERKTHEQT
jgi:hypothetical protein